MQNEIFKNINQYIQENDIKGLIENYNLEKFEKNLMESLPFAYLFFKNAPDTHPIKEMLSENGTYNILIIGEIAYILKAIVKNISKEAYRNLLNEEKFTQTFNELRIFYFLLIAGGNPEFIKRTNLNSPDLSVSIPNLDEINIEVKTIGISKKNVNRIEVSRIITNTIMQYAHIKNFTNIYFESSNFVRQKLTNKMIDTILSKKDYYKNELKRIFYKKKNFPKPGFMKIPFIGILYYQINNNSSGDTHGSISGIQFDTFDDYKKILSNGLTKAALQLKGYLNPFCFVFANSSETIGYSKKYFKTLKNDFSGICFIENFFDTQPRIKVSFVSFNLSKQTKYMRKFALHMPEYNNRILLHSD